VFAYHTCPTICSLIQTSVAVAMKGVDWTAGQEYQAITISIDPKDGVEQAAQKRRELVAQYGRTVDDHGWAFLTGDEATIHEVTKYAGWHYYYDERQKQYAHPSALVLLKPNGRVARYLYGLDFSPRDLRLGLLEASEYKSISTLDRVVLYCYQFDGHQRRYTLVATRVMQLGGVITALLLGGILTRFWLRERRRPKHGGSDSAPRDTVHPSDPSDHRVTSV
jgi:protein SCO1/2